MQIEPRHCYSYSVSIKVMHGNTTNDIFPSYRFLQSHLIWFFLILIKYHIHKNNKSTFAKTEIITDCQNRYEKVHIHNGYNCIPFIRTFTLHKKIKMSSDSL